MNQNDNNNQHHQSLFQQNRKKKSFKWLSHYQPTVDLNDSQYHIIAEPQDSKYQKISIRNQDNSRPITTFLEIQNYNQLKNFHNNYKKQDHSKIKSFSFLDHIEQKPQQIILNRQQTLRGSQWSRKYEPKAFYQLLTEQVHNRNVLTWLKSWDGVVFGRQAPIITATPSTKTFQTSFPTNTYNNNYSNNRNNNSFPSVNQYNRSRLILLSGPPGCGKTTLARTVARHCGYEVVQLNASDDRSGKVLIEKIESLGKNNSVLNNKPTMIIIDQVDGALQQDGNGIKQVLNYIQYGSKSAPQKNTNKNSNNPKPVDLPKNQLPHHQKHSIIPRPIIFICNDPFAKGLRQLRSKAVVVYFRQAEKEKIVRRLKEITEKQKVYVQNEVLSKIAQLCNCDIRSSLSILQYVCQYQRSSGQNPRDLINRLKLSFSKDSNQSILEYLSSIMNESKRSQLKQMINLREFSYNFSKNQNPSLLLQGLFHNFILYKHFFNRKIKQSLHTYDMLKWCDVLSQQSFKYQNQTDHYLMMVFLYYRTFMVPQDVKKIEFPSVFFQKFNRQKQHKETVHQLVNSWPAFLQSTVSKSSVIKDYLYVLYYSVQTSSLKDTDVFDCVSKMITYGIQLGSRNSPFLFKPEFDSLLAFGPNKLQVLYSNVSRTYIQESYAFAKLKANLIGDISLADFNKNTEELMSQLNIKCRRRKRNCEAAIKNSIKYHFIEGSGTQITYDLKFSYFFA